MLRFRRMRSLQKFATVHSSVYNHFNLPAIPLLTGQFQAHPRRCTCPVASTRGGLSPYRQWRTKACDFTLTVPFPLLEENPLLDLVAFHTPRFYGGLVLWYYLSPAGVVLMGELLLVSA